VAASALSATSGDYSSAKRKLDQIESERLRPGARIELTTAEIDAYAEHEAPDGVRNPRVVVTAPGLVTGTAMVDFGRLRRAQGQQPGWLLSKLLDGERPVSVTAQITSASGRAQVNVKRVEISGIEIDGSTLDFLVQYFLLVLYPDAAVSRPFELGHRVDSLNVQPRGVTVAIGR
jgi:hypothetical protein